ncbi:MAG: hypothetical protein U0359_09655 [Byssovorax sp.]
MRLAQLTMNGLVLGAIGWMVAFGATEQRAAELLPQKAAPGVAPADFAGLEASAAQAPTVRSVVALANAYLDRDQPGLASAVLEKAPREVLSRPEVGEVLARALFHRGRAREALAAARSANEACLDAPSCAPWLMSKTTRQVAFFEQVVAAGIDDPLTDPEGTMVAYERSSHEVRLVAMR